MSALRSETDTYMKKIILALFIAGCSITGYGQRYMGVATGNWGGMSSIYLNPANIADNRDRLIIDIAGINAGVDNNLGKLNTVSGIKRFIDGNSTNINDVFTFSSTQNFSLVAPFAEVRGPGVMYSINHRHSIGFSTRIRAINQFNNFNQSLYRSITDFDYTTGDDINFVSHNFNWTGHAWAEAGLTYGAVLLEKGRHELKAGVTVRYLNGIGYIGLKGNNLDLHFIAGQDSIYARNTDVEYSSNLAGSNSALTTGLGKNSIFDQLFDSKAGYGFGGDFGIVYDYIENPGSTTYEMDGKKNLGDQTINRYKFRVSASVTDLGSIFYNTNNNFSVTLHGNGYLTGQGLSQNVKNYDDFRAYALRQGFSVDTGRSSNRLYLPATVMIGIDYHICHEFYVNASYFNNVVNRQNFGNSIYNQLAVTPRYDTRRFSVAVPITYSMLANDIKMGIGLRAYGFYIGSDDMLAFVAREHGMNFYVGGFVPFAKRKVRDRDGDHVSDGRDRCPDDMGTWRNHGCPEDEEDSKDEKKNEKKTDASEREN